ncbi:MAG: hypothetical protein EXR81_03355 [Gammaproteobacteria bacterium]|nr:hypothetical protein [Gammaproteobacteria bacterium]
MKDQHGATLIIILIIVLAIMSITTIGFEMSLLEFKNTTQSQNSTLDFYRAENCLHEAMQKIYIASTPPDAKDYSLLDVREMPVSWWQKNGETSCGKSIWHYTQLLTKKTSDEYTFYRITVYAYPNQLLQVTMGKSFGSSLPILLSWRQG